ncbi:rhodanese-like domain-containing protein [Desulfoluna spongiiphila]|uniref:Rhodanese-related sulfurtransferase n=1 Tax=Desulfoluna spongiiphila TaxID=419481 RepID=A0A1G5EIA5_9BACT|nr:rhodanese-like domain-containing protein [Desulfoluna spongiiphila]SCY26686.1 Rhodanese-related sulfurtransferase [Desulfoluna spongiiphila]
MKQLWPEELDAFLDRHREGDVTLVDVRHADDFEQEHMPGSVCIPALAINERGAELDPKRTTVFVCERGAKSLAVALIYEANFSPEGEVYNLMGGLDAYMGRLAYGRPKIRVIRQSGDLPRMLMTAMDLEKGAWRFYQRLEKLMGSDGPVGLVRKLAAVEIAHMNLIHAYLKRLDPHAPDCITLVNTLPGSLAEGGESLNRLFELMKEGELGWRALFEVALEVEVAAYEMYRGLADSMDGEGAEIFYTVAGAEKDHIRMLLAEL